MSAQKEMQLVLTSAITQMVPITAAVHTLAIVCIVITPLVKVRIMAINSLSNNTMHMHACSIVVSNKQWQTMYV